MGRVAGNYAVYYWMSKATGLRFSWFFPSRKAADKWRNQRFHKYVDNDLLPNHLIDVSDSRRELEIKLWNRHKAGYEDLVLKRAKVIL